MKNKWHTRKIEDLWYYHNKFFQSASIGGGASGSGGSKVNTYKFNFYFLKKLKKVSILSKLSQNGYAFIVNNN